MSTFDPDVLLAEIGRSGGRLCFYPSCGSSLLWAVMRLDADIFVFSDYYAKNADERKRFWHLIERDFRANAAELTTVKSTIRTRVFKSGSKWGFLFFQDNNDALDRIVSVGCKISIFVGINDGCCEGGNYQCVHEEPFIGKVLAISAELLTYFTDHSSTLVDLHETYRRGHRFFRTRVFHGSGWDFQLQCLLVVPRPFVGRSHSSCGNRISRADVEVLFPLQRLRIPVHEVEIGGVSSEGSELCKLIDFRLRHHVGIIAQYQVYKMQPQQTVSADA